MILGRIEGCHCEERSDEAIQPHAAGTSAYPVDREESPCGSLPCRVPRGERAQIVAPHTGTLRWPATSDSHFPWSKESNLARPALLRLLVHGAADDQALDFGGAFVDFQDALVAVEPLDHRRPGRCSSRHLKAISSIYCALANGFASFRAQSMKTLATGLMLRLFSVTMPTGAGRMGS